MESHLTIAKEQIAYLKSLDSKKKKRKFLLDCFIENVESPRIEIHFSYVQKPFFLDEVTDKKPNYSPEEIELVKHNINQREVTEQGSELLKFDKLEIQEDKDIKSHEYCNNIINFSNLIVKCVNMQSDPTNILNQFLLSVNKYYYYKTKNTIDFIDELFPQLKNNEIAK